MKEITADHIEGWREKFRQAFGPWGVPAYEEICDLALKEIDPSEKPIEIESLLKSLDGIAALQCPEAWGPDEDITAVVREAAQTIRALYSRLYVPDVDGERYRAIRDKGIAFSAWQDENGVQWAVNGRVGKDLDALVDEELLKRGISNPEEKS